MATSTSANDYSRGDTVRLEGAPEYKQPFTVSVVYSDGNLKLTDPFGGRKVNIAPEDVERVAN